MSNNAKAVVPLALPKELHKEIRKASKETNLSQADVMRQSIRIGLPKLCQAFHKFDAPAPSIGK